MSRQFRNGVRQTPMHVRLVGSDGWKGGIMEGGTLYPVQGVQGVQGYRGYRGLSTVVCEQKYISGIFHFVLSSINLGLEWRLALMLMVENVQH